MHHLFLNCKLLVLSWLSTQLLYICIDSTWFSLLPSFTGMWVSFELLFLLSLKIMNSCITHILNFWWQIERACMSRTLKTCSKIKHFTAMGSREFSYTKKSANKSSVLLLIVWIALILASLSEIPTLIVFGWMEVTFMLSLTTSLTTTLNCVVGFHHWGATVP